MAIGLTDLLNAAKEGGGEIVQGLLREYIKKIDIESNLTEKPVTINDPFGPSEPGTVDATVKAVQPKIIFHLSNGKKWAVAPAGEPDPSKARKLKYLLSAAGVSLGALIGGLVVVKKNK
jgi:hypothetical protein